MVEKVRNDMTRSCGKSSKAGKRKSDKVLVSGMWKLVVCAFFSFLLVGSLCGCDTIEVEDRIFPLALAVDQTSDIEAAWLNQEEEGTKMVDYNHLKVLILGEELFSDEEQLERLLQLMEEDDRLPRNTYVVVAEKASDIMALNEGLEEGIGTYLEQLLEGNASMDVKAYPTLGMLYEERFNHQETLFLPYLAEQEGTPFVKQYAVLKRGEASGVVPTEMAMISAMLQGNLQKETICMDTGSSVRLENFKNNMKMIDGDKRTVELLVTCDGTMLYQEGKEDIEELITVHYQQQLTSALEQTVDLSNSFKNLGGYQREWFVDYQSDPERYEKEIQLQIDVDITWTTS